MMIIFRGTTPEAILPREVGTTGLYSLLAPRTVILQPKGTSRVDLEIQVKLPLSCSLNITPHLEDLHSSLMASSYTLLNTPFTHGEWRDLQVRVVNHHSAQITIHAQQVIAWARPMGSACITVMGYPFVHPWRPPGLRPQLREQRQLQELPQAAVAARNTALLAAILRQPAVPTAAIRPLPHRRLERTLFGREETLELRASETRAGGLIPSHTITGPFPCVPIQVRPTPTRPPRVRLELEPSIVPAPTPEVIYLETNEDEAEGEDNDILEGAEEGESSSEESNNPLDLSQSQ